MKSLVSGGEESEVMSHQSPPAKYNESKSNQLTFNEYEALQAGIEEQDQYMKRFENQTEDEEEKGPKLK